MIGKTAWMPLREILDTAVHARARRLFRDDASLGFEHLFPAQTNFRCRCHPVGQVEKDGVVTTFGHGQPSVETGQCSLVSHVGQQFKTLVRP